MKALKIKTSELEGVALDWSVNIATDSGAFSAIEKRPGADYYMATGYKENGIPIIYSPSTDWSQCGPLIEKYGVGFHMINSGLICASAAGDDWDYTGFLQNEQEGNTYLVAACRAIVAHKIGDTIDIPESLVNQSR